MMNSRSSLRMTRGLFYRSASRASAVAKRVARNSFCELIIATGFCVIAKRAPTAKPSKIFSHFFPSCKLMLIWKINGKQTGGFGRSSQRLSIESFAGCYSMNDAAWRSVRPNNSPNYPHRSGNQNRTAANGRAVLIHVHNSSLCNILDWMFGKHYP